MSCESGSATGCAAVSSRQPVASPQLRQVHVVVSTPFENDELWLVLLQLSGHRSVSPVMAPPVVPQPFQVQRPPDVGCGPRMADSPAGTEAEAVCIQLPLTLTKGVMPVGAQLPPRVAGDAPEL